MVYSTHHVGKIWCTKKSECVPVRLSCEKFNNSHNCISTVHRGIKHIPLCTMGRQSFSSNLSRAPDNFLKQGVADASLGAKGVFLQNPENFFTPKFLHASVFRIWKFSQGKIKIAAQNRSHYLPIPYYYTLLLSRHNISTCT